MKEVKSSKVASGILKDNVADLFSRLMLSRMTSIESYLVEEKYYDASTRYYEKAASLGIADAKGKTTLLGKVRRALRW